MNGRIFGKKLTSFQLIIAGFSGIILLGTGLLMLPVSVAAGPPAPLETALFTSASAVCVTGLVIEDTASYWSVFGQAVILVLIQTGGLGIASVAAFIASVSGRKISLLQRSMLQDSLSAHHIGGLVKMTRFVFTVTFFTELAGALLMLPVFCSSYGTGGIWMAVFHSISAFCNAGFDIMGLKTGRFSSLTAFGSRPGIVIPVCLLIVIGGIGFLTWEDIVTNRLHFKRYHMQSKAILITTALLLIIPAVIFFFCDFSGFPLWERFFLSLFQAVTPRTAGFNTADLSAMTEAGRSIIIILMLIGGSPGSTAGGMKTTTLAVLSANAAAVFQRKKDPQLFGRRVGENAVKSASTLLVLYLSLTLVSAFVISILEGLPVGPCLFETASAIGTVGLSLGITPSLGLPAHLILVLLMFFGRVGGLTLMFAAVTDRSSDIARYPVEKIQVG